VQDQVVPIVPAAILFDLTNGGDKNWGRYPPYRELGYEAARLAAADFAIGTQGAGTGAMTAGLKGGLGSASTVLDNGITVGALVAVNPLGSVTVGRSRHFWAAPFEIGDEFGGLGIPSPMPEDAREIRLKFSEKPQGAATTIAIIATDAVLTKAAAKRLAIAAHDGFTRAIWPSHTPFRRRSGLRAGDGAQRQRGVARTGHRAWRRGRRHHGAGDRAWGPCGHGRGRRSVSGVVGQLSVPCP
jgi:L-aminopeptidase/D-esterase-like protein